MSARAIGLAPDGGRPGWPRTWPGPATSRRTGRSTTGARSPPWGSSATARGKTMSASSPAARTMACRCGELLQPRERGHRRIADVLAHLLGRDVGQAVRPRHVEAGVGGPEQAGVEDAVPLRRRRTTRSSRATAGCRSETRAGRGMRAGAGAAAAGRGRVAGPQDDRGEDNRAGDVAEDHNRLSAPVERRGQPDRDRAIAETSPSARA